jgi:hypothetical protein
VGGVPKWAIFAGIGIGAPTLGAIATALATPALTKASPAVAYKLPIAVTVAALCIYYWVVNMVSVVRPWHPWQLAAGSWAPLAGCDEKARTHALTHTLHACIRSGPVQVQGARARDGWRLRRLRPLPARADEHAGAGALALRLRLLPFCDAHLATHIVRSRAPPLLLPAQLALFVPTLWLSAVLVSPVAAAAAGAFWCLGRVMYARAYFEAAAKRGAGFGVATLAQVFLLVLSGIGAARTLLA